MKTSITRRGVFFFLLNGVLLCPAIQASAADSGFKPFLSLSEEVNDNIYEKPTGRRSDYITRVRPGATLRYQSPLWSWDAAYTFEYRNYARGSIGDEYNHDGSLKGNVALVDNFFFLDLSDTYKRVSLDVARNAATETSLFMNQTDQNVAVFSPYLLWHLRGDRTLKTGYSFTDTRYFGVNGTDNSSSGYRGTKGIDNQEHRGFADLSHDVTAKLNVTTGYAFTRLESDPTQYNKHDLSGSFKYEYADKSFLSVQLGNSWQQFNDGVNDSYLFWNAAISHDFNGAVGTLETKVMPAQDPLIMSTKETIYSARLDKTFPRGSIGWVASHSEYDNRETDAIVHRKSVAMATGLYEVMQDLTAAIITRVEKFGRPGLNWYSATIYPYRFTGSGGLTFAFNKELTLGLTYTYSTEFGRAYTYATKSNGISESTGAIEISKGVVEVKKMF